MSTEPWQVAYQEGGERTQEVPPVSVPHPLSHPACGSHQASGRVRGKSSPAEGSRTALSAQWGVGCPHPVFSPHPSFTHVSSKYRLPTPLPTWARRSLGEGSSVNQRLPHLGAHLDPVLGTLLPHPGAAPGTGRPRSPGAWPPSRPDTAPSWGCQGRGGCLLLCVPALSGMSQAILACGCVGK